MSQYLLELPDSLLEQAKQVAIRSNISLNQVLIQAINISLTESLLEQWAKLADLDACRAVLAKVPDNPAGTLDEV